MSKKYFITNDNTDNSDYNLISSNFLVLLCVIAVIIFICNYFFNFNINLMTILIIFVIVILCKYILE
jgi:hypothetical protein